MSPDPALVLQGDFEVEGGRQCATQLFAHDKADWPSAIFAANDQMAFGVLDIAAQQGLRVPDDLAVVGFDDHILSAYMQPPLTTVHQPFTEMGHKAMEILLSLVTPSPRTTTGQTKAVLSPSPMREDGPLRLQLPTSLVVRASTMAPSPIRSP